MVAGSSPVTPTSIDIENYEILPMKILIFGDSIVWGAWDRELGWAYRLKKYLDNKTLDSNFNSYYETHVLGVSGDTTEDLLKRFIPEIEVRASSDEKLLIIFAIGINDSLLELDNKKNQVSLEKFNQNIKELISQAKKFSSDILFLGFTPVDESKVNPIPWHPKCAYTIESAKAFDNTLKKICNENSVAYLEVAQSLSILNLEDGIHPNTEGHKKIFNSVRNSLKNQKKV